MTNTKKIQLAKTNLDLDFSVLNRAIDKMLAAIYKLDFKPIPLSRAPVVSLKPKQMDFTYPTTKEMLDDSHFGNPFVRPSVRSNNGGEEM